MLFKVYQKTVTLPSLLSATVHKVLAGEDKSMVMADGSLLASYLLKRQSPPSTNSGIRLKHSLDYDILKDEDLRAKLFRQRLNKQLVDHNIIVYKRRHGLGYLASRLTGTYGSTYRVLKEISLRVPKFKPKTILDFGSGVGSTYWAVDSVWGHEDKMFHSVDMSSSMLELAARLREVADLPLDSFSDLRETRFLPGLGHYDMVVAAYSLSDLSSLDMVRKTLNTLWQQTKNFLVIIENGTMAGHSILSQFRNDTLESDYDQDNSDSHNPIFAPCPHAFTCPLISEGCYFKQRTELSFIQNRDSVLKSNSYFTEKFSYLVLAKPVVIPLLEEVDPYFGRLIGPTLKRRRHVITQLCAPDGRTERKTFTKGKHSPFYKDIRRSDWGDIIKLTPPVQEVQEDIQEDIQDEIELE
ncbi:Methyltransferase-like protein 17, mitochondrial isoform X2 [Oopsacas minuta]|uniref:Methyltransferase-like protein 17, mitochondrial isoform X2 n=1 Tax=Oopsacas minuta TaxID=111878 RepID=A0AAV7K017_9METZ|nr:Methyltransferase-like protein 17, mitochondrial isoform X2 [Oopsacas minuta]